MTFRLPRQQNVNAVAMLSQLTERFVSFASDCNEFLKHVPTIELKRIRSDGTFPIYVDTITRKPTVVVRGRTHEADDTSVVLPETGIGWYPSDDPGQPGIVVTELDGITGPTEYELVLLVLGERT